ncbi:MAG TPA: PEP-CTERM sorting domain-containing protein [Anaerohalosphaeraceae bacterium]|nr:PEP-CTERM sorting domain-containing protein [Anaerohalosphaeraceae bacterium]
MKRLMPTLFWFLVCMSVSPAGYSDGFITAGEYEYGVEWTTYNPPLIVQGGGADWIEMRNFGRLEVRYTSTPLSNSGGIWDIVLLGNSQLLYLDGETEEITIGTNATAVLKGGRIDGITSLQYVSWWQGKPIGHIDLYALPGWSYISNNPLTGIQGQWWDGSLFSIRFVNVANYDPVWMNINVIIPEPTTLALLGIGSLLLRKRKKHRPERTCPPAGRFSKIHVHRTGLSALSGVIMFFYPAASVFPQVRQGL